MNRTKHADAYHRFRHYSRAVLSSPSVAEYHKERINTAKKLDESEPLQGALSDYFFDCWYDVPMIRPEFIQEFESRLSTQAWQIINDCMTRQYYLQKNNLLATRWSVITTPTLDVPSHKLRASSDDAAHLAQSLLESILTAHKAQNFDEVTRLEDEFFDHCLACHDLVAFMKAWFKLGKHDWDFDMRWVACRTELERLTQ
ncbi:hypothetical protein LP090_07595 [Moraxella bovis]|uniref:hypothetical protein n=1 Tax=Moraxella bovis TaxID=476 RepID=UPI0022269C50|nr:hypothetical protein [Moraxella bovis]UYZ69492.1 hypothetical protein LP122_05390 [Moraxella bovis]UYZ71863.1 hypothetical protein LP089_05440 [Moraxella bovis]UYZ72227.1 hypothetical protein LP105_07250 [Moraxella bovis]UZA15160.1 hypothetical protein LP102_05385 [Moraxella bovis]UZA26484.1 hypothetical protein LP119_07470 [Moraxella bovis]